MSQREFAFEDWIREGIKGLAQRPGSLVPEEFRLHMRAAARESLLAYRALIDAAVERTEPKATKKATRIKVE
jgi:hypothetical protein